MSNTIKDIIKRPQLLFLTLGHRGWFNWMPDERYLKIAFRARMGKRLNLDNPQTFSEKLQWLKLYNRKPEYTAMVDKYEVKPIVAKIIGDEYIIPTLGVWERFEDIDFSELPQQFVLKCTHDSGGLVVCKDKAKLDIEKARRTINSCLRHNFFWGMREWPYKDVKPRIIAEKYMEDEQTQELRDYKFFCFDGKVKALFIASDRMAKGEETKFDFFDENYQHLPFTNGHPNAATLPQKPRCFEEMKRLAGKLSEGMPHVRVDFYEVNGKVYFGEMTFFHWSGMTQFVPEEWDYTFGSWIELPKRQYKAMKEKIFRLLYEMVYRKNLYGNIRTHSKEIKRFSRLAGVELKPTDGEEEFLRKWGQIYKHIDAKYYRFYSNFVGNDPNIVPDDCFHTIVEPLLNNQNALTTYSDKNMFELLFPREYFPVCVLRKMGGTWMDRDYRVLQMTDKLLSEMLTENKHIKEQGRFIVKPATETGGGRGVRLFTLQSSGKWISNDGKELTLGYLEKHYKRDFIIQECIEPSDFVRQFNPVSYSTLRIFTYRSVKDDQPHFIGGYLRVGAKDSFRDNMGSGGYSCPINGGGNLSSFASNIKRQRFDNINGVSLTENHFVVPNFDKVLEYVFEVARRNIPNRLLSFDVMLDKQNQPHLIEFNIKWQTVTTVQTTTKAFFGEFTDEVIDYCKRNLDNLSYVSTFVK